MDIDPAATSDVETSTTPPTGVEKTAWVAPDLEEMNIGRATQNAGPTFLDTGAFS